MYAHLTIPKPGKENRKVGLIPVSTTSNDTCPDCPLRGNGCYAEGGALAIFWRQVNSGKFGKAWSEFCASVAALPAGQLWRHNQAGDLPGKGDQIDIMQMAALVDANKGKRGFTYTHKPVTGNQAFNREAIREANDGGFTVNLSANNLTHADELAELGIAPVVTVLPGNIQGNVKITTPGGRRVAVCPATYRDDVTCASCGLCQMQSRKVIVGFPAHGARQAKASAIAIGA